MVTEGEQLFSAKKAFAARDVKGDDNAVADLEFFDFWPNINDLAHILMAENVTFFHRRHVAIIKMEIGAANSSRAGLNDRVRRLLYFRIGNFIDTHIALTKPAKRFHAKTSLKG